MKVSTNVSKPGKFRLRSKKKRDEQDLAKAEKSEKGSIVFIRSNKKINNPDTKSRDNKLRKGDAVLVDPVKRDDDLIEAEYKHIPKYNKKRAKGEYDDE